MSGEPGRTELDDVVEICVERVRTGRATVQDCLERYPHFVDELDPVLRVAATILDTDVPSFDPERMQLVERRVLSHARKLKREHGSTKTAPWPKLVTRFAAATLILVSVVAATGGVLIASADSLPGETLYPVKRLSETIQLTVARDPLQRVRLHTSFAERRWQEALRQHERVREWDKNTLRQMYQELEHSVGDLVQIDGTSTEAEWTRVADVTQAVERSLIGMGAQSGEENTTVQRLRQLSVQAREALGLDSDTEPEPAPTMTSPAGTVRQERHKQGAKKTQTPSRAQAKGAEREATDAAKEHDPTHLQQMGTPGTVTPVKAPRDVAEDDTPQPDGPRASEGKPTVVQPSGPGAKSVPEPDDQGADSIQPSHAGKPEETPEATDTPAAPGHGDEQPGPQEPEQPGVEQGQQDHSAGDGGGGSSGGGSGSGGGGGKKK